MATPTGFPECNNVLTAPQSDGGSCGNLPIVHFPGFFTGSVWELSPEEIEIINQTGKVFLAVFSGGVTQAPVYLCPYKPGVPQAVFELTTEESE